MTGEKRTETRMRCYNTLCIPYISLHPSLHACIVYDCREGRGVIYREYTECYSISFLFLFFFHQSSLYPIKIFAKCFYLLYVYMLCAKYRSGQSVDCPVKSVDCACNPWIVPCAKYGSRQSMIVLCKLWIPMDCIHTCLAQSMDLTASIQRWIHALYSGKACMTSLHTKHGQASVMQRRVTILTCRLLLQNTEVRSCLLTLLQPHIARCKASYVSSLLVWPCS